MLARFIRRSRAERGVSILELAIITPVLLLVIAGIADFGIALHSVLNTSEATRYGARQAAMSLYDGPRSLGQKSRDKYCACLKDTAIRATRSRLGNVEDQTLTPDVRIEPAIFDANTLQSDYVRNPARKIPRKPQVIRVAYRAQNACVFCFGEYLTRAIVGNESVYALEQPCLKSEFEQACSG